MVSRKRAQPGKGLTPHADKLDLFIGDLYRARQHVEAEEFRDWALKRLNSLIPYDAALWGTGNLISRKFHSITAVNLPSEYTQALEATQDINPILPAIIKNTGTAVAMSDLMTDRKFHASELYKTTFEPYNVERILSIAHTDNRSGITTLLSLYRFDKANKFSKAEKLLQQHASYHLVNSASHFFFMHLSDQTGEKLRGRAAICDSEGHFYEAQPKLLDLLQEKFPDWRGNKLPFELPATGEEVVINDLHVKTEPLGELLSVRIWEPSPLDQLTERESEIVEGVSQGLTFKEIGKRMGLAPSTVSNHLYRVYRKLNIYSRSGLAKIVHGNSDNNP